MKEKEISACKIKYFKDISEAVNVQQIISMIQYGDKILIDDRSLLKREKMASEKMLYAVSRLDCNTKETVEIFEQYGKAIQSLYFEIGVEMGICLQAELLLEQKENVEQGKTVLTEQEFKDHLFNVINESDEILLQNVRVDEKLGEIVITVLDGSEFVVRCERLI
ncbi:MAG: hypothetical protein HFI75_00075 [Lachnospiraceae bacterium]|nr:hypothetical protein [Lachnospiraceae bacterium]